MIIRELKWHNVTPEKLDDVRAKLAAKYPTTGVESGAQIALGHGYSASWRYVGTDLVVSVQGPMVFFQTACDRMTAFVNDILGIPLVVH